MSLVPNPEYDKAGYCCRCHEPVAEFDGDQKIVRLLGSYRLAHFQLDNGSMTHIALCERCLGALTPEETPKLMDSVMKGWLFEIDHYLKWPKSKRDAYEKSYSQRSIVAREDVRWSTQTIEEAIKKSKGKV